MFNKKLKQKIRDLEKELQEVYFYSFNFYQILFKIRIKALEMSLKNLEIEERTRQEMIKNFEEQI